MSLSSNKNEKDIIIAPASCYLLKSSFTRINGDCEIVLKDDVLVILKQKDFVYKKFDNNQCSSQSVIDFCASFTHEINYEKAQAIRKKYIRDLDTKKPIPGFEVLNTRTMDKLWISKLDLEQVQNNFGLNENKKFIKTNFYFS